MDMIRLAIELDQFRTPFFERFPITTPHRKDTVYLLYGILGSSSSSNLSFLFSGVCSTSRRSRIEFGVGNCRLNLNLSLRLQRLLACIGFDVIWQLNPACGV